MKKISVFTDGSSTVYHDKQGYRYGGYSVYFPKREQKNVRVSCKGKEQKVTNQRMELKACKRALEMALPHSNLDITIYSDSMYSINVITKWSKTWAKNSWTRDKKEILNLDIIKDLYDVYNRVMEAGNKIQFKHVRSHQKEPTHGTKEHSLWAGNFMADKLATEAMKSRRESSQLKNN